MGSIAASSSIGPSDDSRFRQKTQASLEGEAWGGSGLNDET